MRNSAPQGELTVRQFREFEYMPIVIVMYDALSNFIMNVEQWPMQ